MASWLDYKTVSLKAHYLVDKWEYMTDEQTVSPSVKRTGFPMGEYWVELSVDKTVEG
jgi:hypothetical protein